MRDLDRKEASMNSHNVTNVRIGLMSGAENVWDDTQSWAWGEF